MLGENYDCPAKRLMTLRWGVSACDDCFAPEDNRFPPSDASIDMDRKELREPAKQILKAFLDHQSRHGPGSGSPFQISADTVKEFPDKYLNEVHRICRELENKIRWDAFTKDKNHSLEEKKLITYLRAAVQGHLVGLVGRLPRYISLTTYNFWGDRLDDAARNLFFRQNMMRKVTHYGYDEDDRQLLTTTCDCQSQHREDVDAMVVVYDPYSTKSTCTCPKCGGQTVVMEWDRGQPREDPREANLHEPWWLLMLQGVNTVARVNAEGEPERGIVRRATGLVRTFSTRLGRKSVGARRGGR
ncbi:hypothetical protein EG329_013257 [Mollisiaceae sp. DMI_Dod_QoI]|nr:hypothetical protein EG329_013257 [Helotiales sp. DMI_Dod_QoI]